jgi:hypothetical protein
MKDQNDHHPEVEYFSEGCRWFGADYEPKAARANLIRSRNSEVRYRTFRRRRF